MATSSAIGIIEGNRVRSIYCHNDGYVDEVGHILNSSYKDIDKVKELISLGSISRLGNKLKAEGAHTFMNPEYDVTVAYKRDRGETNVEPQILTVRKNMSLKQIMQSIGGQHPGTMYVYLYVPKSKGWIAFYYDDNDEARLVELRTGRPFIEEPKKVKVTRKESVGFARLIRKNKDKEFTFLAKNGELYIVDKGNKVVKEGFSILGDISWGKVDNAYKDGNLTQAVLADYIYKIYNQK